MTARKTPEQDLGSDLSTAVFRQIVRARRSIRGFKPDLVEREILEEVFSLAQWAPSNCNVQPWDVHVVSGERAETLRQALNAKARNKEEPSPDLPVKTAYDGIFRERQIGAAKALFSATGVARHDLAAREESTLRNYRFFDAPQAAFIFLPSCFGIREAVDCGLYAQTLMLAMTAYGIGSCAQGALSHYPDVVRSVLQIEPGSTLLFGIAFGYTDDRHPANQARTDRASLEKAIRFYR